MLWKQIHPWKIKPPIRNEEDTSRNLQALRNHLHLLFRRYFSYFVPFAKKDSKSFPKIYCVNLIDKKGSQGLLGSLWLQYLSLLSSLSTKQTKQELSPVFTNHSTLSRDEITVNSFPIHGKDWSFAPSLLIEMIWFDYHYHLKEDPKTALSLLYEKIKRYFQEKDGFFLKRSDTFLHQRQLIRTNCMDCLDRTNVVQVSNPNSPLDLLCIIFSLVPRQRSHDGHCSSRFFHWEASFNVHHRLFHLPIR